MINPSGQAVLPNEAGQAVLIVLLGMVVVLTVVLSILAASTSDIRISSNEGESLRAFSAAEAGIEKALIAGSASQGNFGNASFTANVSSLGQGQNNFIYPTPVVSGDAGILWFVSHIDNGTLACDATHPCFTGKTVKICWGKADTSPNTSTTPAVELSLFYLSTPGSYPTIKVAKAIFDPNNSRRATNSYASVDAGNCTIGSNQYAFQKSVDVFTLGIGGGVYSSQNGLQFMPIKMLYNIDQGQPLGIDVNYPGNSTLPSQGSQITSTGNSSEATRKIEVTKSFSQIPPIFDAAVFSPSSLIQ